MKANPIKRTIIGIAVVEDDPIRLVALHFILDVEPGFHLIVTSIPTIEGNGKVAIVILRHSGAMFLETIARWRGTRPDLKNRDRRRRGRPNHSECRRRWSEGLWG